MAVSFSDCIPCPTTGQGQEPPPASHQLKFNSVRDIPQQDGTLAEYKTGHAVCCSAPSAPSANQQPGDTPPTGGVSDNGTTAQALRNASITLIEHTDGAQDRVAAVLGPQQVVVEHMQALPHQQVAAAVATVRASGGTPAVKLAFEFLVLTAVRSGEVRGATWGRDGHEGPRVDHPHHADEGEARPPGSPVPAGD